MNLIMVEMKKFQKTKIKYAFITLFISTAISLLSFNYNEDLNGLNWDEHYKMVLTFNNIILCFLVYGLIAAHTFGNEYKSKTINVLFTYPISRIKLLFSKLAFIYIVILGSQLVLFIVSTLGGLAIEHDELTVIILFENLFVFVKNSIYQYICALIVCAISILTKSVLTPIIIIIATSCANMVVANTKIGYFYPWSAPVWLCPHMGFGRTYTPYHFLYLTLVVTCIVCLVVSIKKYKYVE